MLIQCPRCSTGWRVADTPSTDNPIFKCGRCHNLFRRFPGAPQAQEGERRSVSTPHRTRPPAGDNLEFIFPDEPRRGGVEAADEPSASDLVADVGAPDEADEAAETDAANSMDGPGDTATPEPPPEYESHDSLPIGPENDSFDHEDAADDRLAAPEPDLVYDDTDLPTDLAYDDPETSTADAWAQELEALEAPEPQHAPRVLHVEDVMPRSYGFATIARSLLAIVALHALLAISIRLAPAYASAWLARIPLAGALLAREPTLTRRVELRNVAGTFQRLRNARRVFVITGEAVNRSPASIERIEVEGTLYSGDGRIDQKVVSAGNRTTLRNLSVNEISFLQKLNPRRVVAPGESSAFLIVFLKPPQTVREFSSRVLNVRPSRRLALPAHQSHPAHPAYPGYRAIQSLPASRDSLG